MAYRILLILTHTVRRTRRSTTCRTGRLTLTIPGMTRTVTVAWHGPHESPGPMTLPLKALAVGAIVAGFVSIPPALGGGAVLEHFLEPSFTAAAANHRDRLERLKSRKPRKPRTRNRTSLTRASLASWHFQC